MSRLFLSYSACSGTTMPELDRVWWIMISRRQLCCSRSRPGLGKAWEVCGYETMSVSLGLVVFGGTRGFSCRPAHGAASRLEEMSTRFYTRRHLLRSNFTMSPRFRTQPPSQIFARAGNFSTNYSLTSGCPPGRLSNTLSCRGSPSILSPCSDVARDRATYT